MIKLIALLALFTFSHFVHAMGKKNESFAPAKPNPIRWARPGTVFDLKILTYNIKGLPLPNIDHGKYERIGRFLHRRRLEGTAPQIVGMQEAFHSNSTRDIPKFSKYPYGAKGPKSRPFRINSGLLILSEYKIVDYDEMYYQACAGTDCFSSKGVQRARTRVPVGDGTEYVDLELFNTHMNADGDAVSTDPQSRAARAAQIQEFHDDIFVRSAFSSVPSILAGDFNFKTTMPDYQLFRSLMGVDDSGVYFPGFSRPNTVDYIFFHQTPNGPDHRVAVQPLRYTHSFDGSEMGPELSDHIGIEVDYRFTVLN